MKIEYYNCFTHYVFTTKFREPVINEAIRNRLEKYVTGIVNNSASKLYAIFANPEHMHILVSRAPSISEEWLATRISDSTEKFINENKLIKGKFLWQRSASAFSVSKNDIQAVCDYILNQPEHHKRTSFEEEYNKFIQEFQETLKKG
ncbi:MAG: IS200/IS605 family transposase [Bacteroidales bacterium]|nr:IS200/IS605 family transposase [Bacteroidales bacterium]MDD3860591.1 IS200/IS605 family transposase [Bacteroidales bacterium]